MQARQGKRVPSAGSLLKVNDQGGTELNAVLRSLYEFLPLILRTPGNAPLSQIIRAYFKLDVVTLDYTDIIKTELARNVRRNNVTVRKFDFEICVGQALYYLAFRFYNVVL